MKKSCLTILISLLFSITLPAGPGAVTRRIPLPSGFTTGLAFDGEAFWTVDRDADKLFRIDAAGGRVLAQFDAPGYFCTALAWDGQALWVADMDFTNTSAEDYCGKIYRVDTASGRILKVSQNNTQRHREHELTWGSEAWAHWSRMSQVVLTQ